MANNVKVKLNRTGVKALLRSEEMRAICEKHASDIVRRCGEGYETDSFVGRNRVNVMVSASTYEAKRDNAENNTILKAVKR